ncbi:hypothetical protein K474DRAFT_1770613 [Panus rudis PR-1116 ss-1]|nr:hypothetical protein K474DRAFT_1770613 [Panus rudis PR-1116 ss-1]
MSDQISAPSMLGGLVMQICISFFLYGVTLAQSYMYLGSRSSDPPWTKVVVLAICVLETLYSSFVLHLLFVVLTVESGLEQHQAGMVTIMDPITWCIGAGLLVENAIIGLAQGFNIYRLWRLSGKSVHLITYFGVVELARFSLDAASAVFMYVYPGWSTFREHLGPLVTTQLANYISAIIDTSITASLVYFLARTISPTQIADFKSTCGAIRWVITYTVNVGALTSIVSIAIAVTFTKMKHSLLFLGLLSIASRLYANAFLGSLNSKRLLRLVVQPSTLPVQRPATMHVAVRNSSIFARVQRTGTRTPEASHIQRVSKYELTWHLYRSQNLPASPRIEIYQQVTIETTSDFDTTTPLALTPGWNGGPTLDFKRDFKRDLEEASDANES